MVNCIHLDCKLV